MMAVKRSRDFLKPDKKINPQGKSISMDDPREHIRIFGH